MRKLEVTNKTGFKVTNVNFPVVIRDHRGILFYTTEPLLPRVKAFNLPPGTYFVDSGYFIPMDKPVKYRMIKLPFPERLLPKPSDFQIVFGDNPNKCTIFWKKGIIQFDNSFREKPLPQLFFILYHEFGHARYKTEEYADLYAVNCMLAKGFNVSQIGAAPLNSLSENANDRKTMIIEELLKYNS